MPNLIKETQPNAVQPGQAAAVIGASALPIVGDLINYKLSQKENERAYQRDIDFWNKQNLYNHPSKQMARLKEAGLNPNLVYGNGTQTQSATAPEARATQPNFNTGMDALGKLGMFQNIKLTQAQTDNVQAETANKITENTNKTLQQAILRKEAEKLGIDIDFLRAVNPTKAATLEAELYTKYQDYNQKEKLFPTQVTMATEKAKQSQTETEIRARELELLGQDLQLGKERITAEKLANNIKRLDIHGKRSDNDIKQQNLIYEKWKSKLTENGITTADNIVVRALLEIQKKYGLTYEQMFPNLDELIKLINQNVN